MKRLKHYTIIGIIFVLIAGTAAHFLYDWSGNRHIVGLITPVSESIWEHMKLLFFPMLLYSLIMIFKLKEDHPCITSSLCFGTLTGTFLIPAFFYSYICLLGRDVFILDIGTFIASVIIAFLLSYKLTLTCRLKSYTLLLCGFVCILFFCFLFFTYHPPDSKIFEEYIPQE